MLDVLPLVLLLVMGVVISTTCGKYTSSQTSHSSSSLATQSSSTSSALLANSYYTDQHHPEHQEHQDQLHNINDNVAHQSVDSTDGAQQSSLIDTSQSSSISQTSDLLSALLAANNPSNRLPSPPAAPPHAPPHPPPVQHNHHYNHRKHLAPNDGHIGAAANAYQSDSTAAHTRQHQQHHHNHHQYYRPYYLTRVMLNNASVTCNDGTVAGYYIRQNYASRQWIVFLEGGWYCFSPLTCHQRWLKMRPLMTSAHWPEAKTVGGILSSSRDENPHYWNASHVYIPYCSSDIWSGDSAARAPGDLSFLGSRIVEQVIRELLPRGLSDAKLLILAGSSAGAAGVMINLDRIADLMTSVGSKAQVRGIADSGWILDNEPFNASTATTHSNTNNHNINKKPCVDAINCAPMDGIKTAFKMWSSRVPSACAAQYPREPWRCIFGYRLYPTLRTPLFVFQWLYDEAQMHMDGVSLTHSQQQFKYIHNLGRQLRASLENVSAVFTPSCIAHIVLTKPDWRTIAINGIRLPDAIRCWEQTCSGSTHTSTTAAPDGTYTVIGRHSPSGNDTGNGSPVLNDWPQTQHNYYHRKPDQPKKKPKRRKHMRRRHKTKRDQIVINADNNSTASNNNHNKNSQTNNHNHYKHQNTYNHQAYHNQHRLQAHRDHCHHWLVDDCQWPQCNRECPKIHKNYID